MPIVYLFTAPQHLLRGSPLPSVDEMIQGNYKLES